ncbi:competence protein CoiA [Aeromonas allosaccharophila]|uniref:competence protein CoiA n=1 Tax=Aeromonas TaxID=642 RepID=UPI003007E339
MKFSLVNGIKTEPFKSGTGICFCCGGETLAKCGNFKVHHWAHKSKVDCDPWWENEGEWHRKWKNYFPIESQEIVFEQPITNERHIADIFINQTVIEIQSYPINEDEARLREAFYNNMIWIIDGCKNEFDKVNFGLSIYSPHTVDPYLRQLRWHGRSKLFAKWSKSSKPVYFDFGTDLVWHLLQFDIKGKKGLVKAISKEVFVNGLGGKYT